MPWTRVPRRLKSLRKKYVPGPAIPQRLEAAIDAAALTARVELVPFPKPVRFPKPMRSGVFPQTVKARLEGALAASFGSAQGRL
jgi:hypothetical protein